MKSRWAPGMTKLLAGCDSGSGWQRALPTCLECPRPGPFTRGHCKVSRGGSRRCGQLQAVGKGVCAQVQSRELAGGAKMVAARGHAPRPFSHNRSGLVLRALDPSARPLKSRPRRQVPIKALKIGLGQPKSFVCFFCFLVNANLVLAVQEHRVHLEQMTQGRFDFICVLLCCLCFIALTLFRLQNHAYLLGQLEKS